MDGKFPDELRYTTSDEWVRRDNDELTSGITEYASDQLGDVVYIQLPKVGARYEQNATFGEIESVKAVSDLYCPITGEVIAANDELDQNPALVNEDPYGSGWIVRLRPDNLADIDGLLDAGSYEQNTLERH